MVPVPIKNVIPCIINGDIWKIKIKISPMCIVNLKYGYEKQSNSLG